MDSLHSKNNQKLMNIFAYRVCGARLKERR